MRKALLTEKEMKKDEEVTNKYMKEYLNTYKNPDTQIYGSVVKDKDNTENKEEIHFVQEKPDSTKIEIKEKKLSKEELKEEIKSIVQEVEEERDRKEQNKSNTDLEAQSKIKIDPKEPHLDMTNIKRGIKEVYGEKRFFMNDGIYISSLTQLVSILDNIEVEVFNRHVNDQKNDFYNWVYDTFQNKQLAAKIKDVRNKKEMSDVIKDYLLRE